MPADTLETEAALVEIELPAPDAPFTAKLREAAQAYNRVAATSCVFQGTATMTTFLTKGDAAGLVAEKRLKTIGGGTL